MDQRDRIPANARKMLNGRGPGEEGERQMAGDGYSDGKGETGA